jgi:hypothetical protein
MSGLTGTIIRCLAPGVVLPTPTSPVQQSRTGRVSRLPPRDSRRSLQVPSALRLAGAEASLARPLALRTSTPRLLAPDTRGSAQGASALSSPCPHPVSFLVMQADPQPASWPGLPPPDTRPVEQVVAPPPSSSGSQPDLEMSRLARRFSFHLIHSLVFGSWLPEKASQWVYAIERDTGTNPYQQLLKQEPLLSTRKKWLVHFLMTYCFPTVSRTVGSILGSVFGFLESHRTGPALDAVVTATTKPVHDLARAVSEGLQDFVREGGDPNARIEGRLASVRRTFPEHYQQLIVQQFVQTVFSHLPRRIELFSSWTSPLNGAITRCTGVILEATIGNVADRVLRALGPIWLAWKVNALDGKTVIRFLAHNQSFFSQGIARWENGLRHAVPQPAGVTLPVRTDISPQSSQNVQAAVQQLYRALQLEQSDDRSGERLRRANAERDAALEFFIGLIGASSEGSTIALPSLGPHILNCLASSLDGAVLISMLNRMLVPRAGLDVAAGTVNLAPPESTEQLIQRGAERAFSALLSDRVPGPVAALAHVPSIKIRRAVGMVTHPAAAHADLANPSVLAARLTPLVARGVPRLLTTHPQWLTEVVLQVFKALTAIASVYTEEDYQKVRQELSSASPSSRSALEHARTTKELPRDPTVRAALDRARAERLGEACAARNRRRWARDYVATHLNARIVVPT